MIDVQSYLRHNTIGYDARELISCAYSQKHRKYHGWNHIERLLDLLRSFAEDSNMVHLTSRELEYIELAILAHDIVYVPGNKTNEQESALIGELLFPHVPDLNVAITVTRDHTRPLNYLLPQWVKVLLDLDLYDLATDKYWANSELIEDEFLPFCANSLAFLLGRKSWIESMIDSQRIFWTLPSWMEERARANLAKDLERVKDRIYDMQNM